jgi:mRNA interferase RelE/StbE
VYAITYSLHAQKFLDKLDRLVKKRIMGRIKRLEENPVPSDAKFLSRHKNDRVFRYRIGAYRALYKIKEQDKTILISKIDKRSRVYKN